MEEYKRFHSAIKEVSNENLLDWYMYRGAVIGASVGGAVGGITGSAAGPLGTLAGLGAGVVCGGALGFYLGGLTGYIYEGRNREQKDQCKKLIESYVSCVKELEENTHELQTIQDLLNEAEKSF